MWSRVSLACILLLMSAGVFAGQNGFGVAPVTAADAKPNDERELPFAPWVKTSKVGDFIERKIVPAAMVVRMEVKEITTDWVVVTAKNMSKGDTNTLKYSRKETRIDASSPSPDTGHVEVNLKKSSSGQMQIGGKSVTCDVWDGFAKGTSATMNGAQAYKALKTRKIIGQGVPFGGVVKVMLAKDDGKEINLNRLMAGPIKNAVEEMDVLSEVVAFGNTQEKK